MMEQAELVTIKGSSQENTQRNHKRRIRLSALVLSGLIFLLSIFLIATGRLVVLLKQPSAKAVILSSVCDYSIVEKYNSAVALYISTSTVERGRASLKDVSDEISKKQAYTTDSTCLYIRYQIAYINGDYSTVKSSYDGYASLINQGKFADGRLNGITGLDDMKSNVEFLKPSDD